MAKKKNSTISVVTTLVFLALFGWAWRTYAHKAKAAEDAERVEKASKIPDRNAKYEEVTIPDSLVSHIVEYPGFTVSFNPVTHTANYVAWELTSDEMAHQITGRGGKNFAQDTRVKGCATTDDYRGSGYDRGHMAPAGDMKWAEEAMISSFMLTNIVPQDHDLNQGAWRVLEEKCREWAIRDSALVIVCGPIFDAPAYETIGETGVRVPQRFFKVILAPYVNPPQGIGFIMPNAYVPGGIQPSAVSIDSVESVTGFDFFSALPDEIETEIETQCNFPRWSRKR